MEKIKICEIIEAYFPYIDGVVNVVDNYAKELNKISECKVLTTGTVKGGADYSALPYDVIKSSSMRVPFMKFRMPTPGLSSKLKKTLRRENFDIYHIHSPFNMARYILKVAKRQKKPVVITFHTKYREDFERMTKSKFLIRFMMRYIIKTFSKCDAVWAVTESSADTLRSYGFKGEIMTTKNGTDMKYPEDPAPLKQDIIEKYNLKPDEKIFLFVGRIFLYKNLRLICDSLKILKEQNLKFKMFFVGDGEDMGEFKDYIDKSGLNDDIILTGLISDRGELAKYFIASDLFLFPSTFDTSSLSTIEAAQYKLPAVLIEGSAAAEGKTDGVNCFLSEENAQAYAAKISEACADDEFLRRIGENAAAQLVTTWEKCCVDVHRNYQAIIEKYKTTKK